MESYCEDHHVSTQQYFSLIHYLLTELFDVNFVRDFRLSGREAKRFCLRIFLILKKGKEWTLRDMTSNN